MGAAGDLGTHQGGLRVEHIGVYAGGIDKKIKLLKLERADMAQLFVPKKGTAL